jgi:secondary thiamine-phosphate synthase enzyme
MKILQYKLHIPKVEEFGIVNITQEVKDKVKESGIKSGIANVFVVGATGAVTTIEFEKGLIEDFKSFLSRTVPRNSNYLHNRTHAVGNAHSHILASILGPSLCVPVIDGEALLGTWQQVVIINFDSRPRDRNVVISVIGE